jgi:hypothetical protein
MVGEAVAVPEGPDGVVFFLQSNRIKHAASAASSMIIFFIFIRPLLDRFVQLNLKTLYHKHEGKPGIFYACFSSLIYDLGLVIWDL